MGAKWAGRGLGGALGSRMAGGRVGRVRSLSPLTSATDAAEATSFYRLFGSRAAIGYSVAVRLVTRAEHLGSAPSRRGWHSLSERVPGDARRASARDDALPRDV